MTARSLPPRPNLDQLKRQAKERLRLQPQLGRLRDAQRTVAEEYGFASWDALRTHVESVVGAVSRSMIKPPELDSEEGGVVWNALTASDDGDVDALRRLVERDPRLSRAEYWYTPAIHFAVREGHLETVQLLLDAGADPEWNGLYDGSLIVMARDRGHDRHRGAAGRGAEPPGPRRGWIRQPSHSRRGHPRRHERGPPAARCGSQPRERRQRDGASPLHRAVGRGCARARRAAARSRRQRACDPQRRARSRRRVLDRSPGDRSRHLARAPAWRPPHHPVAARARCDLRSDRCRGAWRHRTRQADPRRGTGANSGNAAERTTTALRGHRSRPRRRSRACFSSVAPTRTGASRRRRRVDRCRLRRAPANASWSSYSSRTARIRTAASIPPATRLLAAATPEIRALLVARGGTPIRTTRAGSTTMRNSRAWREIQGRLCAFRRPSRWSSGTEDGIGSNGF